MFEAPPPQATSFAKPSNHTLFAGRGKENEVQNSSLFSSPSSLQSAASKDSGIDLTLSVPADPPTKNNSAVGGLETAAVEAWLPIPTTTVASVPSSSTAVSPAGSSQQQQGPIATKRLGKKAKKCIHGRMAAFCVPCEGSQVRIDDVSVLFV